MKIQLESEMLYHGLGGAADWRDEGIMNFLDKGVLLRVTDPGDTGVYSMLIPADSMETYERRGMDELGFDFSNIIPFLSNSNDLVQMEVVAEDNSVVKVILTVGSREYTVPAVETQYINGSPDRVPELDYSFVADMEWDFVNSFIKDFHKIKDNGGGIYLSVQNGMMWLWAKDDDNEIKDFIHLEDMELSELDYSSAYINDDIDLNPRESEEIHNLMGKDVLRSLSISTDRVRFHMDNYSPIKVVSEHDTGLKQSWIITPRIPKQDSYRKIPENVITRRNVIE